MTDFSEGDEVGMQDLSTEDITKEHQAQTPKFTGPERRETFRRWEDVKTFGSRFRDVMLAAPNAFLDIIYDRADLWADKEKRIADHAKVRGFFLYTFVIAIMTYVGITSESIGMAYLWVLMSMLAASVSERVLMAFFKAWGARGVADAGSGSILMRKRKFANVHEDDETDD